MHEINKIRSISTESNFREIKIFCVNLFSRMLILTYFAYPLDTRRKLNPQKMSVFGVESVRIRSFSGPYFPAFGLNTKRYFWPVYSRIRSEYREVRSKYGKIRTRITPNTDTFSAIPVSMR